MDFFWFKLLHQAIWNEKKAILECERESFFPIILIKIEKDLDDRKTGFWLLDVIFSDTKENEWVENF